MSHIESIDEEKTLRSNRTDSNDASRSSRQPWLSLGDTTRYKGAPGIAVWVALCTIAGCFCAGAGTGGDGVGDGDREAAIGARCIYQAYPGTATIVAVSPMDQPSGPGCPPYLGYEVRFRFTPDGKLAEPMGQFAAREQTLRLVNSWAPGSKFLAKYGITNGRKFACRLQVLTRGTCAPFLFDFPDIDLGDFFELRDP